MNCEILASVMNQHSASEMINILGINSKQRCVIINQITDSNIATKDVDHGRQRFYSFDEVGLSRSRNRALDYANGDICIVCDNDCHFVKGYEDIITKAYDEHPEADIITFDFEYEDNKKCRKTMRQGKVGFMRSMKISSTQITFRLSSIKKKRIRFDVEFGTGSSKYNCGEENIFLFDCLKAGLKIYHVPKVIIVKGDYGTTWDKSSTPGHFEQQGAIYYRMSPRLWRILALQFAVRKHKIYNNDMSGREVLRSMKSGARKYRKEHRG